MNSVILDPTNPERRILLLLPLLDAQDDVGMTLAISIVCCDVVTRDEDDVDDECFSDQSPDDLKNMCKVEKCLSLCW